MTASTGLYQVFRWVKYLTYALLSLNIWLFFSEELNSARFAIETGEEVALGVQLFSATLDTLAWVILLGGDSIWDPRRSNGLHGRDCDGISWLFRRVAHLAAQ